MEGSLKHMALNPMLNLAILAGLLFFNVNPSNIDLKDIYLSEPDQTTLPSSASHLSLEMRQTAVIANFQCSMAVRQ